MNASFEKKYSQKSVANNNSGLWKPGKSMSEQLREERERLFGGERRSYYLTKGDKDAIIELHKAGVPAREIADAMHRGAQCVRNCIREWKQERAENTNKLTEIMIETTPETPAEAAYRELKALSASLLEDASEEHFELVETMISEYNAAFPAKAIDPELMTAHFARVAWKRTIEEEAKDAANSSAPMPPTPRNECAPCLTVNGSIGASAVKH